MIKEVFMGEYYILGTLGLVRTIARARNCETGIFRVSSRDTSSGVM